MGSFVYISIAALICYLFLMIAFIAAKKNKLINSFLVILGAMILWTGGSFCMRMLYWPSINFWYNISILGLTLLPYAFFNFVYEFVGARDVLFKRLWLLLVVIVNIINSITGAFLPSPEMVKTGNEVSFVYHPNWTVLFMFLVCAVIVAHMIILLIKNSKNNELIRKQFTPIIVGIAFIFAGHIIIMFPFSKGFPADILSGVINAGFMFYALYRRSLFKLTLLVSRGVCYLATIFLAIFIFSNVIPIMERLIESHLPFAMEYEVLIIAVLFTLAILLIYYAMKKFIDSVFTKEEILRSENLKKFSSTAAKSLNANEILEELAGVIQSAIGTKRVYICVANLDKSSFVIAHSSSPLAQKTLCIKKDNPMIVLLKEHGECLLMRDFKRTIAYKSMWEEEKVQLAGLEIECIAPLKDEEELVGIILLSGKVKSNSYTFDDVSFLASVDSVSSIALKNSKLYERAYMEARIDELTGLLNRKYFYETIQNENEKNKGHSLALIILNIDDFKLYNQLYGNKEGDLALQKVAQIIRACVGESGYVARYSGKEFAIILPLYDILAAKSLAENIRKQILNMNKRSSDYTLKVLTVSGGICAIPYAATTVKQLIENADMAVYHAKRQGKNVILVYSVEKKKLGGESENGQETKKVDIYAEYAPTIYALTAAIDAKDHYTFSHSKQVAYYATELAYAYGMTEDYVKIIKEAALLHDIGKIGIPEHILNKPGKLDEEEFEIIKGHVENSIGIIRHLPSLDYVIPAVIGHHERYDGKGYPRRISKEDIPVSARILCIADSFDAMVSKRSYKPARPVADALKILDEEAGRQFDPKLVPIFIELVNNGTIKVEEENVNVYEKEI